MQKWEYKIVKVATEAELNRLGEEGWELISVTLYVSYYTFFFKRPKSSGNK